MLPVLIVLGLLIQAGCLYFTGEGRFLTWQNLSIVAQQASVNAVLAAGMTFVILTGGIDLSYQSAYELTCSSQGKDVSDRSVSEVRAFQALEQA
jgi:predicted ABC-type sugar transport system permease subunit